MSRFLLREKLKTSGLSLRQLALLTGISSTQATRIERGFQPTPKWMLAFLELYSGANDATRAATLALIAGEPEWRMVRDFDEYEVCEDGRVRRAIATQRATVGDIKPFWGRGYLRVNLCRGGKIRKISVHRLVAVAFLGDRSASGRVVCHRNGDRSQNGRSNLYWGTHRDNALDRVLHKTHASVVRTRSRKTRWRANLVQLAKGLVIDQAERVAKSIASA